MLRVTGFSATIGMSSSVNPLRSVLAKAMSASATTIAIGLARLAIRERSRGRSSSRRSAGADFDAVRFRCLATTMPPGLRGAARTELLGEPNENPFGSSDVAEAIHVLVLNHLADELRAATAEPNERLVEIVHGEHDAEVA